MKKQDSKTQKQIIPLMGFVLIEPEEAVVKTQGGIFLPEQSAEKPAQGKVVSVGEDLLLQDGSVKKCPVKVGDVVMHKRWGGDDCKIDNKEYKLVKFEDLMAIIR